MSLAPQPTRLPLRLSARGRSVDLKLPRARYSLSGQWCCATALFARAVTTLYGRGGVSSQAASRVARNRLGARSPAQAASGLTGSQRVSEQRPKRTLLLDQTETLS